MFLAKVIGQVVSTKKDEAMKGYRLLVLRPQLVDATDPGKFRDGANTVIAIDTMGAGTNEMVLFCQGSSARQASGLKTVPVDCAVTGIVDSVDVLGSQVYKTS
ncbi:EutN/CcmL family microcompartment protein [Rubellicoccus peritrichatus]|uniref:EutN/CcmL family microcompartment protein n=1 Tax=Rubellicoccus peritrichatus TaxID=3080537 RepID=A0AAQ3QW62_9BACT|nr:EutN/CcmL family microcompartment protein [Puniceicoccus sp. CR14]WOO41567.1 EutN/CcmL family microcompartment protein [Puniceicoccus sp. CR14]